MSSISRVEFSAKNRQMLKTGQRSSLSCCVAHDISISFPSPILYIQITTGWSHNSFARWLPENAEGQMKGRKTVERGFYLVRFLNPLAFGSQARTLSTSTKTSSSSNSSSSSSSFDDATDICINLVGSTWPCHPLLQDMP